MSRKRRGKHASELTADVKRPASTQGNVPLSLARGPAITLYVAALLIGLALILLNRSWTIEQRQIVERAFAPASSADSRLVLNENDAYYWIAFAERMATEHVWRIRYTHLDNAPAGREVHWSQSVSWLLLGLGALNAIWCDCPVAESIPHAALWLNTILQIAVMLVGSLLMLRRLGVLPAAIFAVGMATLPEIAWQFDPLRPDHQTLHAALPMFTVLFLYLGELGIAWKPAEDAAAGEPWFTHGDRGAGLPSRGYFVAAGITTGLALWVGATVQYLLLGAITLGVVTAIVLVGRAGKTKRGTADAPAGFQPALWRTWGIVAAATGTACYAVEYFPRIGPLRLEVNHPIYAVACVGCGEFIARLGTRVLAATQRSRQGTWWMIAAAAAALLPAALFIVAGPEWHALKDPQMRRLHEFIVEFNGYGEYAAQWGRGAAEELFRSFGLFLLVPVIAGVQILQQGTAARQRCRLTFLLVCTLLTLLLGWLQVRWLGVFSLMLLLLASGFVSSLTRSAKIAIAVSAALLLPCFIYPALQWGRLREVRGGHVGYDAIEGEVHLKALAAALHARHSDKPVVCLTDPSFAPALHYFGGVGVVSTYYWENTAGLHAATEILAAPSSQEAEAAAREREIDYVIVPGEAGLDNMLSYVKTGRHDRGEAASTLLGHITRRQSPRWLRLDNELSQIASAHYSSNQSGLNVRRTVYVFAVVK